jgi:hypothetical protein
MARALLVSYAGYPYTPSSLVPDNGLANLGGALLAAGHEVLILDYGTVSTMRRLFPAELAAELRPVAARLFGGAPPEAEALAELGRLSAQLEAHQEQVQSDIGEELAETVRRFQPDFVGFKLWNGQGFTGSVALAERLHREFPDLPLYAGGPQASWFGEHIYRRTGVFTAIAHGEGERTIVDLAEHATGGRALEGIPGIIYPGPEGVQRNERGPALELDDLPAPVYDPAVYPAMAGEEKIKIIVLDDSRGCPFGCAFCTHPLESGRRLRTASPGALVDRMADLGRQYGYRVFRFSGSSTPGSLLREVAEGILERGLDVEYACFGHFASADAEHFEVMARSGLYSIFFGIESGCEEILQRAVGKRLNLGEVQATVAAARRAGIFTVTSMIVPLPFDTEATLQTSLDFLLQVRPDSVPVQFPGLLPGTPWTLDPAKYGFDADPEEVMEVGLDYQIKLLFPPAYWQPLPYKVNGMSFSEFTAVTTRFAGQLEAAGILTGLSDDNALIAHLVGHAPRDFRNEAQRWLLTGDVEAVSALVQQANQRTVRPPANPG